MTAILIGIFTGLFFGGPFGALFGGFLGAWINKNYLQVPDRRGYSRNYGRGYGRSAEFNRQQAQSAFFNATFLVMGRLAKADGRVSEDEIATASAIMKELRLSQEQRQAAIRLFNQGKQPDSDIEGPLQVFRQVAGFNTLVPMFLEIQLQAAYADGALTSREKAFFNQICSMLGINSMSFELLHKRFLAQKAFYQGGGHQGQSYHHFQHADPANELKHAYDVLGVAPTASDAEVKRAYRKLMSQHHPDKLVAKGLPEEMMEVAKQKAQEIQGAYDTIREHRKK